MLQLICLDLDKIFKRLGREKKSEKKLKKMRERTDVYGCTGVRGGKGHSAFMIVLPVLYYNGLQRSFASLHMALICAI